MAANNILARMAVLIDAQTAEFNRKLAQADKNFNSFGNNIKRIAAGFGAAFGTYELLQQVNKAIGIMADFESTMSEVKAITGTTGDEFKSLERDALRLGASTQYTSEQVGKLQIAYGRLGFTTKEILDATEATLDLAAATGEDLAKSADVAGSTVRGFQLNAKETQRVVDVMAASFNKTALGLENFTESMKYVAPVANAAGATVEETTAMLGVLADAGIRGSMAGTSLRKIFTDMTKDGRPLQERLAELAAKGITLQDSFDEVGRTAQTSLLILSKNTGKIDELTKSFQNVAGEAARVARIMRDNLTGDAEKLSSAWEGLILKMGDTSFLRKVTQDLTGLLNLLSGNRDIEDELNLFARAFSEGAADVPGVAEDFIKSISEIRREVGKPIDIAIVQELAEKYKLTDAQANKFYQSVLEINKALSFQEKAMQQFNDFAERNGYKDLGQAVEDYKNEIYRLIVAEQIAKDKNTSFKKFHEDQIAAYRRVINILNEYKKTLAKPDAVTGSTTDPNAAAADSLEALKKKMTELNEAYDKTSSKDFIRLNVLGKEIQLLHDKIETLEQLRRMNNETLVFSGFDAIKDMEAQVKPMEKVLKGLEQMYAKFKATSLFHNQQIKQSWYDMSTGIAGAISGIADAMGQAIGGTQRFGDAILKVLAGFARQVGETLIGIGVAMLAAKKLITNPYTAIAAGVALVALAGALNASLSKAQSNFNSGGGGLGASVGADSSRFGSFGRDYEIKITIDGKIQGNDIVYILNRTEQLNGRTRG